MVQDVSIACFSAPRCVQQVLALEGDVNRVPCTSSTLPDVCSEEEGGGRLLEDFWKYVKYCTCI